MILRDPYQAKCLHESLKTPLVAPINRAIVTDYSYGADTSVLPVRALHTPHGDIRPVLVTGKYSSEQDVPVFVHPVLHAPNRWIAMDLRAYVRVEEGWVKPRNEFELALAAARFRLACAWAEEKYASLYSLELPHHAFAEWLSSAIARKFGLNMSEQAQLFVLSALYYTHRFTDTFTQEDVDKLQLRLQGQVFVQDLLRSVADNAGELNDIQQFCQACERVTGSARLRGFSYPVLINTIARSWYSLQGETFAPLALEYPPIWIAMVLGSVNTRSFKTTAVAQAVATKDRRGAGEKFARQCAALLAQYQAA